MTIYDFFLLLYAIALTPKLLWQQVRGKQLQGFKDRLGLPSPKGTGAQRIWIHAVSVGEVKAAQTLIEKLQQEATLLLTTTTVTGLAEAHRLYRNLSIRLFPLDFSWIMRRWITSFRPDLLLFIEGDIWPNLIREARLSGAKTALVSGKISNPSVRRFRWAPPLARHLFGSLDLLSVQNEEHHTRFASLVKRPIQITGNLKLDLFPQSIDADALRKRFSLSSQQPILTLSCTHAPEEKELLNTLSSLWKTKPNLVLFLAPRHPERFEEVADILRTLPLSFCRWNETRSSESIVLVDTMGQLAPLYAISKLAIVGGSFSSRVGGHNVLEPCLYGCPVLFGPHMQAQRELAAKVLEGHAGWQVTLENLLSTVCEQLDASTSRREQAIHLIEKNRGCAQLTYELLKPLLKSFSELIPIPGNSFTLDDSESSRGSTIIK